jgi:phage anti-repressor protein
MITLIPLSPATLNGAAVETVNARSLDAFLHVRTAFRDWLSRRIVDYGFCEERDFCSFLSESSEVADVRYRP